MRVVRWLALAAGLAGVAACQEVEWPVRGSFQVPPPPANAEVRKFAARDSGLYFLFGSRAEDDATILHTDANGSTLNWLPLTGEKVGGMAVDSEGSVYVLSGGQTLLGFDSRGMQTQSTLLESTASALTLIENQPWGVRADGALAPLAAGTSGRRVPLFRLPAGTQLYPVRSGAVAWLDGESLKLVDLANSSSSSTSLGPWVRRHPGLRLAGVAAAGEDAIFVLGTPARAGVVWILQLDRTAHAQRELRVPLPPEAAPGELGIASWRLFLADWRGSVWYADAPSADVPAEQRLDSEPVLLSDMEPFLQVLRKAGNAGRVSLSVTVDEEGRVRDLEARSPSGNPVPPEAIELAGKWRFSPAIKGGKKVPATFRLQAGS